MASTHMGYGFVIAYFLIYLFEKFLFNHISNEIAIFNVVFVLAGLFGGAFPDLDRWEDVGFKHRRTLHYVIGYGSLVVILIIMGYFLPNFLLWILGISCFLAGAGLHSAMDILDGFWAEDINKGVYEHIRKRWIKAMNLIPFASLWEWSLQSLSIVAVIAISPHLAMIKPFPGWAIATISFFTVWFVSTFYEFYRTVPKRWEMEDATFRRMGFKPNYKRRY